MNKIIEFSLKNRMFILILFAVFIGISIRAVIHTPIDAFPDTTPVQVQINTVASNLNPSEIEQQITLPIELSVSGFSGLINVRSISKFGLSQVVATFDDNTDIYDARQFIIERLISVDLPEEIDRPQLGPISTGLGEVFHYSIRSSKPDRTLDELRTIHDWIIKPELRKVPGVAEVNSWGGFERQYQVIVSPESLVKYKLTLNKVFETLAQNNHNVGGGRVVSAGQSLLVHGLGRVSTIEQIENIVLKAHKGAPVSIKDIADVVIGHEIRRGAVTADGQGEVVLGLGFALMGENSKKVTEGLKKSLNIVRKSLPEDVKVEIVYDRTDLISKVINTVKHNLVYGAILVVLVLFLILGNFRVGLLVAIAIPISMLFAIFGMYEFSIAASLLSMGAIDFGIIVDGSVVMTEINMRKLNERQRHFGRPLTNVERLQSISESGKEVIRPIIFGMGIIIIVFLPILALEGIEGKMFRPMAWTFIFAMTGALSIAILLSPILSYYFLPRKIRIKESFIECILKIGYTTVLTMILRWKYVLFGTVFILLIGTAFIGTRLGGEFIPKLNEGAITINTIRLAGVSIEEAVAYNSRIEKLLLELFPDEIRHIWSRVGTAEVATDPMGIELTDIFITLNPRDEWKRVGTQADLIKQMEEELEDLPGINMIFTQPIEMRLNEMVSGIRSDVGVKIYGDNFEELVRLSNRVQEILKDVNGVSDVSGEQITGQPTLQVIVNQAQIARYGIPASDVLNIVKIVGVHQVGDIFEGQRRFPLVVRLPEKQRIDVEALASTFIPTESGQILPLRTLAEVRETEDYSTINREWGRRLIKVQCNVRDRDIASFVQEARTRIENKLSLPEGYVIEWGGQFEHLERSRTRFMIVVPIALLLIFLMLYFSLKNFIDVFIIYTGIPFAFIGGVFALWGRGMPFSVSAAVGFIALSGIAVLNGQILVSTIRMLRKEGLVLDEAVKGAAKQRLLPVMATAITDAAGFIPMAISTGVGAEVQRPLATVVIGGVTTCTLLTLFVLPALYITIGKQRLA
ncbi:MAG: efflux RND transporter permease subunit [Candidatus Scalindua sp.]|jgi:cobalt-zinc-cadmium resistance protein CzcA|nr:efflux RND transporter permease subunit [Candidatus Scalindua sp.]MBT5306695.1 efflux RND transporter permease subunit [Candidatus Scalindua sp.]MBT6226851.1 efflux RND transporter permease subunit [Candidatus Scalindua sp.]MBT7211256.1 efflux RND transporter permease subunit [Candidatus Scalindua sp.]MBT7593025.1 efflux RND transporter permease subunit [Candidatus Scalindua sp.]